MPANLTQQYYAAEEAYKKATTPEEKLAALEEMLATIPKHKGTEKLQAEIKKRISRMRKEGGQSKGGSRQEDPFLIDRQGAGQVFLLGWPNAGKSALVQTLTNAKTQVTEYPFATALPIPGMMQYKRMWESNWWTPRPLSPRESRATLPLPSATAICSSWSSTCRIRIAWST